MIKYLRFTYIFFLLLACSPSTNELDNYFEQEQIEELNRLTEFVVDQLTSNCEGEQSECLLAYFDQFRESGYDFELIGISRVEQTELLNSLSESMFAEIWTTCEGTRSFAKDSTTNIRSLCINTNERFANFLKDYCSKNKNLFDYGDAFEQAGGYSPSMNAQLIKNPKSFDFNSKDELLLVSIHLLTLNNEEEIVESVPNSR